MSRLDTLLATGFPITWAIIREGWRGPAGFLPQLTVNDVVAFAWMEAERIGDPLPDGLDSLLLVTDAEREQVGALLESLAREEGGSVEIPGRVWRTLLLSELLDSLDPDPVQANLQLYGFWAEIGSPGEAPHDLRDPSTIRRYADPDSHAEILRAHREWLAVEAHRLRAGTAVSLIEVRLRQFDALHPSLRRRRERLAAEWFPDDPPLSLVMGDYAHALSEDIEQFDPPTLRALFAAVEETLAAEEEPAAAAVATGFLECLQGRDSGGSFDFRRIAGFLGPSSRAYCRAWDEFTGAITPGLEPEEAAPRAAGNGR
jgi:hypothetical protein